MRLATSDEWTDLLQEHEPPCISLYQPTHRRHPDNQQDPIRFRNLLREVERSLDGRRDAQPLLARLHAFARDEQFWNHRTDGLAFFASPGTFRMVELQRPVRELAVVAGSFHTKPLVRAFQSADRFHVLGLNRHEARLFQGHRYALDPLEMTGIPATIDEALGEELTEQHLTVASYGSGAARAAHSAAPPSIHGQGDRKDELDVDRDRFFRVIDRAVWEHYSRPSGLPLLLAALPEHHAPFRAVSHNPQLLPEGIMTSPDDLSLDELRAAAWQTLEPRYLARLARLVDDFRAAQSHQRASDDLAQAAEAVAAGRIATLLVEDERHLPGRLEVERGRVQPGDPTDPDVDDVLDDLAEAVLRTGGEVVVVPAARMPTETGLAAIYRY